MSIESNLQLIKQLFSYYGQRDIPSFLALFSEDAVWVEPGDADIPYAGSFKGRNGIMDLLTLFSKSIQIKSFLPTLFVADGDNVIVSGDNEAVAIPTGKNYSTKWVYAFTIKDNLVTNLQVYMDTLIIAKAFTP